MTWRIARLEDVAQVLGGGTPSRAEPAYFGGGVAWATPTDVTALDGLYISTTKESVTDAGLRNSSTKLMPPGAVLLTSRATIGFTAVAKVPICTNQGFVNFICGDDLLPEYLAYWLRTQKDKMLQHAGGTTFKEIARGTIRKFEIGFPPLDEQRRIVDLLSRGEGIVRLRREATEKAAGFAQSLFSHVFQDSERFESCALQDLIDSDRGISYGVVQRGEHFPGGIPLLRIADFGGNTVAPKDIVSVDPAISQQYRRTVLVGGEIVVSIRGTVGRVAVIPESARGWNVAREVAVVPLLLRVSRPYLHTYMLTEKAQRFMLSEVRGIAQKGINLEDLRRLPVPLPRRELIERFEAHLAAFGSVAALQASSFATAEATSKALSARAFSGDLAAALEREAAAA